MLDRTSDTIHVHGNISTDGVTLTVDDDGGWRTTDRVNVSRGQPLVRGRAARGPVAPGQQRLLVDDRC